MKRGEPITGKRPWNPRLGLLERKVLMALVDMRKRAGVSRNRLAADFDVAVGTVWRWETGKTRISLEVVENWCHYFGEKLTVSFGIDDG